MNSNCEVFNIKRVGEEAVLATDLIYSPDDNGFYFSQTDLRKCRGRVSRDIFPNEHVAGTAFLTNKVKWERWS